MAFRSASRNSGLNLILRVDEFSCNLQAYFKALEGDEPLALDMNNMGKGQIWINGQSLGRYWTANASGNCSGCSYTGSFRPAKCQFGCDQPTQRWYKLSGTISMLVEI